MTDMSNELQVYRERSGLMSAADVLTQVAIVQEVMQAVMKPDVHYGVIPGTPKPTLYKPGAERLCAVFRIADRYEIEDLSTEDAVRYRVRCIGTHAPTGTVVGEGMGECSSSEKKYKWIKAYPSEFEHTPENRRRKVYGWDKQKKKEYEILQVRTDPADLANTVLKMANKRAKVAMTLNVTAASDMFTQDVEDLDERLRGLTDDGDAPEHEPLTAEKVADLKATLDKAAHKGELRRFLQAAMLIAAEAHDKAAHAALKAHATERSASLPEEPAAEPITEEPAVQGADA